jgi:WD40 repeat protein
LVTTAPNKSITWDFQTGKELYNREKEGWVAFLPETGRHVFYTPSGVSIVETATGRIVKQLGGEGSTSMDLGAEGKLLAKGNNGSVSLWKMGSKQVKLFETEGHQGPVYGIKLVLGGEFMASAGRDGTIRLWDVISGKQVYSVQAHGPAILGFAYCSAERLLASGGRDGTVKIWKITPADK